MRTIGTEELRARLEAGPVAVFDVRGDLEFEFGHIPGSMTAPLGSLAFRVASVMRPDSFVVVYSSGTDGLAASAAERLGGLRLTNVHRYEEGLEAWKAAGLPVVPSVDAKVDGRGPVIECRHVVVDRESAYGGVFKVDPTDSDGAGG